jgi:ketopantoate reductase
MNASTPQNQETFVIYGGGASGLGLAAKLIEAGANVIVVDKNHEVVTAINKGVISKGVEENKNPLDPVEIKGITAISPDELSNYLSQNDITPTAAFTATYNFGPKAKGGKNDANYHADISMRGVKVINLENGINGLEASEGKVEATIPENVVLGTVNSPSKFSIEDGKAVVEYINANRQFNISVGSDASQELQSILTRLLGTSVDVSKPGLDAMMNKIPGVVSMAVQAILGTKFADAANPETETGKITTELLTSVFKLSHKLKDQNLIGNIFGNDLDTYLTKQRNIMNGKGGAVGSMTQMHEKGLKTENGSILGGLSDLLKACELDNMVTERVYDLMMRLEFQKKNSSPETYKAFKEILSSQFKLENLQNKNYRFQSVMKDSELLRE